MSKDSWWNFSGWNVGAPKEYMKNWRAHSVTNSYGVSQIKIWFQKFRNGDLSCKDSPRSGRHLLTLWPQLEAFMQKYPFASARVIAQHFITTVLTIKDILQRELGMRRFSRRWVPHFPSPAQSCLRQSIKNNIASSTRRGIKWLWRNCNGWWVLLQTLLSIFNNVCAGATRDYSKDAANNWREKAMIMILFTARQLILLDVLPKGSKFNQQYFIDYVLPDLKMENRNFCRRMPLATFVCTWIIQCVTIGGTSCQNSTSITLSDCRTHPIRQTWARATFGSSGCWKESWMIESFIRVVKLKRQLRWPGITSHSMRSRATFINR
jgi:hypothetical protein